MTKIRGQFAHDLSIENDLTRNKTLFALWTGVAYTIFGLCIASFLKFDQLMGGIFLDASTFSFANGLKYGIRADKREKEVEDLKKSGISKTDNEKSI